MDLGIISVRYARALLKSATEVREEDLVYADMQSLSKSYIDLPPLRQAINNPMIDNDSKLLLLKTACGAKCADLSIRFFKLVLNEGREEIMQLIASSYITLYRKQKNLVRAKLTTAAPVSKETEDRMRRMVERKAKGTVKFQSEIDPDIIGGFVLEYDTYRMDASVKSKLQSILTQLKK